MKLSQDWQILILKNWAMNSLPVCVRLSFLSLSLFIFSCVGGDLRSDNTVTATTAAAVVATTTGSFLSKLSTIGG